MLTDQATLAVDATFKNRVQEAIASRITALSNRRAYPEQK